MKETITHHTMSLEDALARGPALIDEIRAILRRSSKRPESLQGDPITYRDRLATLLAYVPHPLTPEDASARTKKGWEKRQRVKHDDATAPEHEDTRPALHLVPSKTRAWNGEQTGETTLTKLETDDLAEHIILSYLRALGMTDARSLNVRGNNFPVDFIQDHEVYELKAGLASNGPSAQHWRATEGEPGKAEKEWLKTASPEAKAAWHLQKQAAIMRRKQRAVRTIAKEMGHPITGKTVTMIINPDTRRVDVYQFDGFHRRIGWRSDQAQQGYLGSYRY